MSTETRSTCPYCGVGCGVIIQSEGVQITGVRGDPDHPANQGRLCSKGSTLHLTAAPALRSARLLQPLQRLERGGTLQAIAWDDALDQVADRFAAAITQHGPDSVGFYLSGQLLTEDYQVFNKLARGLVGTNNVDSNSRLCMSSAVAGYKASLGADAPPTCYEDLALADTVWITGSNLAWAHPILMRRLEEARQMRLQQRWVVVDPRRTETAASADLHLQIQPGTDVALHHALLHVMLWEQLIDPAYIEAHTSGFAALRERVRPWTPAHAARVCGLQEADILTAARWFAGLDEDGREPERLGEPGHRPGMRRRTTLSLYCQGLNQSRAGTDKNTSLINLHLATGQIGRPGAGPFSLTGQPNAMGGREVGGMATLLPGHRDPAKAEHRAEVAALWGVRDLPATPGKAAVQLFEAAAEGQIKALWIACTNPAQSLPDQALVQRALQRCDFVVLQEAYRSTATAAHADLLLPAASWGEKEGTVTNSERRISRVRAAVPAPGEARPDWAIAAEVGRRLEARLPSRRLDALKPPASLFPYDDPEAVWREHREATRGRDLDITGLDWSLLESAPRQWPFPEGAVEGQARLYTDGRYATPDGRARFTAPEFLPTAEVRDARRPFSLTTGRLRDQWHGLSRTGTLGRLWAHSPEPVVELHPTDLARRRLHEGQLLRISSRRGSLVLPLQASEEVAPTQAHIAMHWGAEVLPGQLGVNALTIGEACPQSRQPELKHAAVRIEPADLPWQLSAGLWLPEADWQAVRERLHAWLAQPRPAAQSLAYTALLPFGREEAGSDATPPRKGLRLRAAAAEPMPADALQELLAVLYLDGPLVARYSDRRSAQTRALQLDASGRLQAFLLAGDTRAQAWAIDLLQAGLPAAAQARALLADAPAAPDIGAAASRRGPQVCNCVAVDEARIVAALDKVQGSDTDRLAHLQARLNCGTQCGSCLPRLRQLVRGSASQPLIRA